MKNSELRGVMTEEVMKELDKRNEARRANAIVHLRAVGKYLLDRRVARKPENVVFQ